MSSPIIPESFCLLLMAFQGCFHAPSYANFRWLVAGWVQCLGRRTITAVVVAAGAIGERHISVFHRFFARAQWSLEAVGRIVFQLALRWIPADQPLYLLGDDTLARKSGKCVSLASMHHDPLLSSGRKPFFSFGHVWVVLAIWVPLPMGERRGFALPILVRLYTGAKRGRRVDAPSRPTSGKRQRVAEAAHAERDRRTKLELLRELVGIVASGPATGQSIWRSTVPTRGGRCWRTGRATSKWSAGCAWTRRCGPPPPSGARGARAGRAAGERACPARSKWPPAAGVGRPSRSQSTVAP